MGWKWWGPVGRWRWLCAGAIIMGIEAWLLMSPGITMQDPAFEVLCALSCWIPAWCCADLLSISRAETEDRRERSVSEVIRRGAVRLLPVLPVLGLWCGTFTYRSLQAELKLPNPRFLANIENPADLLPAWFAWSAVFVVSGFAYGAGTGLCSALARRPRRWLVAPAVVVGASHFLTLGLWLLGFQSKSSLPFGDGTPLPQMARQLVTAPSYSLGSMAAFMGVDALAKHHEILLNWLGRYVPSGIAMFCWVATLFFGLIGLACTFGILWIARNRYRRHPHTGPGYLSPEAMENSAPEPG